MSLSWFIARRYLTARRQAFISVISAVSIAGVGVGVAALIIALALMTGVQSELRDRIVGSTAHVYVYRIDGQLDVDKDVARMKVPGIVGVAPALTGQGMMKSTRSDGAAVQVKGIDPQLEPSVTDIKTSLTQGTMDALEHRPPDALDGVILGVDLAHTLGVTLGDPVTLITPQAVITPTGASLRPTFYQVVGIARFGYYETDASAAFVTLHSAARALGKDGPDLIQIRLKNMNDAPRVREQLQTSLGGDYQVQDWIQLNGPLYSALWLEKVSISLTIGLIVIVAALNIVASLVLLVMEKSQDIAILRTMGTSARAIRRIFLLQGLTIGLIGTLAGTALGLVVCFVAERYKLIKLPSDVYQITYLPFRVEPLDVLIVVVSAVLVCVAATVYPARQAGRLDPAEALRHQ
jgi:lipoprotein-releasing system permease protein